MSPPNTVPAPLITADEILSSFEKLASQGKQLVSETDEGKKSQLLDQFSQDIARVLGQEAGSASEGRNNSPKNFRRVRELIKMEDKMLGTDPEQKINRASLLQATGSRIGVDTSYEFYELLPQIDLLSKDVGIKVRELLGTLNNYDSYINVRGVLSRKEELLRLYANGSESSREQRFATTVAQSADIMNRQREVDGIPKVNRSLRGDSFDPYERSAAALTHFLEETNSGGAFKGMGFSLDAKMHFQTPANRYPSVPRVEKLSPTTGEHTFVAVHQVFETIFDDALRLLRTLNSRGSVPEMNEQTILDIRHVSAILRLSTQFYPILEAVLDPGDFFKMRDYFGIASGAQSFQYHMIEQHIGLPFDANYGQQRRAMVGHIVGRRSNEEIAGETTRIPSLKERYATIGSQELGDALRELNVVMLQYKVAHGKSMLKYLPGNAIGTAGTKITDYFARNMGPIFPVFTDEEKQMIDECRKKAIHKPDFAPLQSTDRFRTIGKYVDSLPISVPSHLISAE